jgi:hypothetical protein
MTFSPNWADRLFGVANFRSEKPPFNLFSLSDWQTIGQTASRDASTAATSFVSAFADVVVASGTPDSSNQTLTWGEVVTRYESLRTMTTSSRTLRRLRIDASALRAQNVTALSPYSTAMSLSVSDNLVQSDLAVVASPDSILLTSVARLGDFDVELQATTDRHVFVTQRVGSSFASGSEGVVSSHDWSNEIGIEPELWMPSVQEDVQEVGIGWRHYQLRPVATSVVQFAVYRPAVFRVMGWGIAFVMIALVVWFSTRRVKSLVLIVLAAILTLLVPYELVPVARGMMWGGLAGLLMTFLREKDISAQTPPTVPLSTVTVARTTVFLLVTLGAWQVFADDDVNVAPPEDVIIYRVVIPVDEEGEVVGDFVHVPKPLYNSLHRPASVKITSLPWMLRSAAYETSLALRADADGLVGAEVSAYYELETFQMDTIVAFPLGRDDVRSLGSVKLDGQVIEYEWNPNGEAFEFSVLRSGRHRLEFVIRPVLRNDAESSGFAVRVLEFAGARLKVSPSTRIEGITLPSVLGAIKQSESMGTIDADMGPTNTLAVRWPLNSRDVEESIPLTVVERFWLRIQPSSVALEGQFAFSVPRGGIEQVRLLVDPRLKLSQLIPSHAAKYDPEGGPNPSIVIRFDDPAENRVLVHATFLMTDTSGLGHVYLPRLSAVADANGGSTLALSIAPELDVELVADPPLQAILPAVFLTDWKEPTDPPQLAYRLDETPGRWYLTSRPQVDLPVTQQLSNWSIGWTSARLHYSAVVDPGGDGSLQQRLRVPASLVINNLELIRGQEPQVVRWTRANEILTVFFLQAIKDQYRLVIDGEAPTAFPKRTDLPLVSMQGVEFQSNQMVIRQRSNVLIKDLEATGLVEDEDALTTIVADYKNGRVIKSFSHPSRTGDQPEAKLSFSTKRNQPRITGRIVNHVNFGVDDAWFADAELTLEIKSGIVDELRLALPAAWSETLVITPAINHEIVGSDADRVLVLRLPNSFRKKIRVHIRCQSQRPTVALSDVPLLKILNKSQVDQLFVLPGKRGAEIISWATTGLQPIPNLPSQDPQLQDDESTTYKVEGPRATAVVHNLGRPGGTPRVQLADIKVAWNHDRTCYGVVAFDVTPMQLTECILEVPPRLSIAHVNVAGVPVTLQAARDRRLRIPLGPDQLPQRIDVVFFGRIGSSFAIPGETLSAPTLANLPVDQTLWTVHGPVGTHLDKALLEHTLSDVAQHARLRARSATLALEIAEMLRPPVPEAGFESWRQNWERRRDLARQIADGTATPLSDTETASLELTSQSLQGVEHGRREPVRFAMQGVSSSVNMHFSQDETSDLGQRTGISVGIACLGLLFGFVRRRFRLREWFEQSWHALGVSFGVIWWLWFTPSSVGLLVMGLFLLAALWPVRRSQRLPRRRD